VQVFIEICVARDVVIIFPIVVLFYIGSFIALTYAQETCTSFFSSNFDAHFYSSLCQIESHSSRKHVRRVSLLHQVEVYKFLECLSVILCYTFLFDGSHLSDLYDAPFQSVTC